MSALQEWLNRRVLVVTNDGRSIVGTLKGFDHTVNVVLDKSVERIYSETQGMMTSELGLHVIRGDNIALVAEVDEEKDSVLDHNKLRARSFKSVVH